MKLVCNCSTGDLGHHDRHCHSLIVLPVCYSQAEVDALIAGAYLTMKQACFNIALDYLKLDETTPIEEGCLEFRKKYGVVEIHEAIDALTITPDAARLTLEERQAAHDAAINQYVIVLQRAHEEIARLREESAAREAKLIADTLETVEMVVMTQSVAGVADWRPNMVRAIREVASSTQIATHAEERDRRIRNSALDEAAEALSRVQHVAGNVKLILALKGTGK